MSHHVYRMLTLSALVLASLAGTSAFAQEEDTHAALSSPAHPAPAASLLEPARATEQAPAEFRVAVTTTKGTFVIEVTRAWAPNGADRVYNLVTLGYYDDTAFFRGINTPRPFMAQVGYHGDPAVTKAWRQATIPDDPILKDNLRGFVTFAMSSAPNSRTTQFFINYTDNSYLAQYGKFAPFGTVVEGMEVVDALYGGYGEGAPQGRGPDQRRLSLEGNTYLKQAFPKLDYIIKARLVPDQPRPE